MTESTETTEAPAKERKPRPPITWFAVVHKEMDGPVPAGVTESFGPFHGLREAAAAAPELKDGQLLSFIQTRGPYKAKLTIGRELAS